MYISICTNIFINIYKYKHIYTAWCRVTVERGKGRYLCECWCCFVYCRVCCRVCCWVCCWVMSCVCCRMSCSACCRVCCSVCCRVVLFVCCGVCCRVCCSVCCSVVQCAAVERGRDHHHDDLTLQQRAAVCCSVVPRGAVCCLQPLHHVPCAVAADTRPSFSRSLPPPARTSTTAACPFWAAV